MVAVTPPFAVLTGSVSGGGAAPGDTLTVSGQSSASTPTLGATLNWGEYQ